MKKLFTTLALLTALAVPSMADIIQNGGFESGSCNPGAYFTISAATPNATCIANWTVSAGSIDYIGTHWQNANGSSRSIDLSGGNNGTISQTFNTVIGKQYLVEFMIAGNPDGPPPIKGLNASAGDFAGSFTFNAGASTRANMGWQSRSFVFVAQGTSTTLSFSSTTGTAYGSTLDAVSVNAVPEPAAFGLLAVAGFAAFRKRRSN